MLRIVEEDIRFLNLFHFVRFEVIVGRSRVKTGWACILRSMGV